MNCYRKVGPVFILLLGLYLTSCNWVSLAYNALRYQTTSSGAVANVVTTSTTAYGTMAEQGIGIYDLHSKKQIKILPPAKGTESIDDVAIADNFLFTLDAKIPGHLSVYSISDPQNPILVSGPVDVPVEPFSGVSAGAGRVIVSGGTKKLTLRSYDSKGILGSEVVETDLGRGQPDVLVSPDGSQAYVSTHYSGPRFGFSILGLEKDPLKLLVESQMELPGAGFTQGGFKPANFPIEMALLPNTLLIAHQKGIAVIDILDPKNPKLINLLPLDLAAVNIDADGLTAAVVGAAQEPKVLLLDFSIPTAPQIIQTLQLPTDAHATGVAINHEFVVVAAQNKGLLIFNR